ncbi:MAG: PAS domain-containing protein [Alphaproteobacteria bacterium]|nr:PAS domain-containing protein [Alphaproteobacteria bacterium]
MVSPRAGPNPERWRKLVAALDEMNDPIIVAGDWRTDTGVVLHVNRAWSNLTGFAPGEALGRPGAGVLLPAEHATVDYESLKTAVEAGQLYTQETLCPRKNAPPLPVEMRASVLRLFGTEEPFLVAVLRRRAADAGKARASKHRTAGAESNILSFNPLSNSQSAGSQRLAKSLVAAQLNFQNNLDACPFGVERTDAVGRITYANPIYHDLLGYAENDLIGEVVYERLQTPAEGRALETYVRHILAMRPHPIPILTRYRRKNGTPLDVRLDWTYDRSSAGAITGLLAVVTPIRNGARRESEAASGAAPQTPEARDARAFDAAVAEKPADAAPDGNDTRDGGSLRQTLHAAQIWTSILAHRHPEDADADIVTKLDKAIDEGLRLLGGARRPLGPASQYFEETVPLVGLVVVIVEPVEILRTSLADLIRSWGCTPVPVARAGDTLETLRKSGRLPDIILVDLEQAIGLDGESVIQALWTRYGPGVPAALIADELSPAIEKFADAVGMKIVRRPVHPIELRSALLALWRRLQKRKR